MKKLQAGNSEQGADHSGQAVENSLPLWSPCQSTAECIAHRCRAILDDAGNVETFECFAYGVFLRRGDAVQA